MGAAVLPLMLGSGVAQGIGADAQGHSQSQSDKYNAEVSYANAKIAAKNAEIAGEAGAEQAAVSSLKGRAAFGSIKTNQAASGVDVNSGSAVDTQASAQELSKLDAMTIRSNAAKEAYGYKTQEASLNSQGDLLEHQSKLDETAGIIGGVGTLLGSGLSGVSAYEQYQSAGGLGG